MGQRFIVTLADGDPFEVETRQADLARYERQTGMNTGNLGAAQMSFLLVWKAAQRAGQTTAETLDQFLDLDPELEPIEEDNEGKVSGMTELPSGTSQP